mmetsp:Transcript_8490/g.16991  ORF Transcript_8490/g.16991 Transcript_8490/m.16991 type:complete len:227 (-) Transcript_8490:444-1124(-)
MHNVEAVHVLHCSQHLEEEREGLLLGQASLRLQHVVQLPPHHVPQNQRHVLVVLVVSVELDDVGVLAAAVDADLALHKRRVRVPGAPAPDALEDKCLALVRVFYNVTPTPLVHDVRRRALGLLVDPSEGVAAVLRLDNLPEGAFSDLLENANPALAREQALDSTQLWSARHVVFQFQCLLHDRAMLVLVNFFDRFDAVVGPAGIRPNAGSTLCFGDRFSKGWFSPR